MKIDSVDVFASNGVNHATLSFIDPTNSYPYLVKALIGLDADEILPVFKGGVTGKRQYDLTIPSREVVMRMGLNPSFEEDETYSDLRDAMYRVISASPTSIVQLRLNYGGETTAAISGLITKYEAPVFNKTQEIQLTLDCTRDPWLKSLERETLEVNDSPEGGVVIVDEKSTAPTGFLFNLEINEDVETLTINWGEDYTFVLSPGYLPGTFDEGFLDGDVLYFSSERNEKALYVVRGGEEYPIADKLIFGSVWPLLYPGSNTFDTETDVTWGSFGWFYSYWGI